MESIYMTINNAVTFSGMSRTSIYEFLKAGTLKAKKVGRRTLISSEDIRVMMESLPDYKPKG